MVRLTAEQKQFYEDNGYIVLKNVFSKDDFKRISEEYDNVFARNKAARLESAWVGSDENDRLDTDSNLHVNGIHNLQHHHAVFGKLFLYNDNMLDALEDIMDCPNIMLHHTKAHNKPPEKGAAYPMHQDYPYFPYLKHKCVAAFLHLDRSGPENGGLYVYPGSHKLGILEDVGAREGNFHYVDQTKFPLEKATPVIAEEGDLVLFSYLLVHGSSLNTSKSSRRMLLAQFLGADDVQINAQPLQPGYGWMLRGVNIDKNADQAKRCEIKSGNIVHMLYPK